MKKIDKNEKIDLQIGKQIFDQIHRDLLPAYMDFFKQMQIKDKDILTYMYAMECYGSDVGEIRELENKNSVSRGNPSGVMRNIRDEKNGINIYERISTSDFIRETEYLGFEYTAYVADDQDRGYALEFKITPSTFEITRSIDSKREYLGYYDHDGNEISQWKTTILAISFKEKDGCIKAKNHLYELTQNDDPKGGCSSVDLYNEEYQFDKPIGYVSMCDFGDAKGYQK